MERFILWARLAWYAPLLVGLRSPSRLLMQADAAHCTENHPLPDGWTSGGGREVWCALIRPESRSVYYARLRDLGGGWRLLQAVLEVLYPGQVALEIAVDDLGSGLYLQHGFATMIAAEKIGTHCTVSQQVTIGYGLDGARPTLGDNVGVAPGAKIVGGIHVGDNVVVGVGAVVIRDVPSNAVVAGVPAKILRYQQPGPLSDGTSLPPSACGTVRGS